MASVGGDEASHAVVDADNGVVDEGVVGGDGGREVVLIEAGAEFGGEVVFGVDVGGAI